MRFVTGADRIVLWVTLAYAREYMLQHYAYAPVPKRITRELSRYDRKTLPDFLPLSMTFYDLSVSHNLFSKAEMRQFSPARTEGLNIRLTLIERNPPSHFLTLQILIVEKLRLDYESQNHKFAF